MNDSGTVALRREAARQGEAVGRRLDPHLRNHVVFFSHSSSACIGSFDSEAIELRQNISSISTTTASGVFRWLSKDPILFAGGQVNLYVYCHNDPVSFVDPLGLGEFEVDGLKCDPMTPQSPPFTSPDLSLDGPLPEDGERLVNMGPELVPPRPEPFELRYDPNDPMRMPTFADLLGGMVSGWLGPLAGFLIGASDFDVGKTDLLQLGPRSDH